MDFVIRELLAGLPTWPEFGRVLLRLVAAAALGAVAGIERERLGKPAGLRTHMLVSLGSALFVLVPMELGLALGQIQGVIQGVAAGIGFLGAGAILKLKDEEEIQGLTSAAGIWMTAAIGVAVGLGGLGIAIVATVLMWVILSVLGRIDQRRAKRDRSGVGN